MESITVGGLTFRWSDGVLVITTPMGQHLLNGRAAADILVSPRMPIATKSLRLTWQARCLNGHNRKHQVAL